MKANQKFKLDNNGAADMGMVGMIVALLITIIISVMVYFEVTDSIDQFSETTEIFTGYTRYEGGTGSNFTGVTIDLINSPVNPTNTNVTCWNESGGTGEVVSYPTFGVNHKTITIGANAASNFTQVNITYTNHMASTEGDEITPMATTVFSLLPVIALVVVAGVILFIVLGFGRHRGGGL